MIAKHCHSFKEWLHIEEGGLRLGHMSETAIVVDECQEFGSGFMYGFQALLQLSLVCVLWFCNKLFFTIKFLQ